MGYKYVAKPVVREDGRHGWHITHRNGHIVATDGGQGYERPIDAETALEHLLAAARDGEILIDLAGPDAPPSAAMW